MLYLTAYFGHVLLLPKPYPEVTEAGLFVQSPYHGYTVPWSDISGTHESIWPRRKGLKALAWAILTGQIRVEAMPVLVVELTRPHWYVGGLLIPPIPLLQRDTCWDFFRSDEFDEFFER